MTKFVDHAREVLDRREQDGVRGIDHERNRFLTHIEYASFAQQGLDAVTAVDLRDWIRDMQSKPAKVRGAGRTLSSDTVKRAFSLVSAIFTDAVERDIIKVSPVHGVKVKKRADARATREKWAYLTLEEQKAIAACEAIPLVDRLAIRFAIATGLRQGGQFNLLLTDLHTGPNKPRVVVRYGSKGLPPKSGKMREVPLFGDGLVAARRWLYELAAFAPENPERLAFPSRTGSRRGIGKPLGRGTRLREHLAEAGITRRIRWHDLRHTFCSNLATGVLGHTWPLLHICKMAGHSSVTITERYAHVGESDLVRAGEASSFAHEIDDVTAAADFYAFDWEVAS